MVNSDTIQLPELYPLTQQRVAEAVRPLAEGLVALLNLLAPVKRLRVRTEDIS
jgi:hypothetical protein